MRNYSCRSSYVLDDFFERGPPNIEQGSRMFGVALAALEDAT